MASPCLNRWTASWDNGTDGFADVWKREFFAIEYKGKHKDLNEAYQQLLRYREDLGNPPLLVVCDMNRLIIHTNFTNTMKRTIELELASFDSPTSIDTLRSLFFNPEKLKPGATVEHVSKEAARKVGALARRLEGRKIPPMDAASFVMKLVFALFAESVDLLPGKLFSEILSQCAKKPSMALDLLEKLFKAMRDGDSGMAFTREIPHFNGGLFEDTRAFDLEVADIKALQEVAGLDWSTVDPVIFGNLYEYGLGVEARSMRGVHYTSREDIRHLVEPTILRTWRNRWQALRLVVAAKFAAKPKGKALEDLKRQVEQFRESLGKVEVLDPACGSGNFLLVTLQMLLDLELEVIRFQAENFHVQALSFHVGPHQLHGIEYLAFPHALASVVVWIGHLQWLYQHGYSVQERPILQRLELIQHGDSLKLP